MMLRLVGQAASEVITQIVSKPMMTTRLNRFSVSCSSRFAEHPTISWQKPADIGGGYGLRTTGQQA